MEHGVEDLVDKSKVDIVVQRQAAASPACHLRCLHALCQRHQVTRRDVPHAPKAGS